MSKKKNSDATYPRDVYSEAFRVTGQVGFLLLHDEIERLGEMGDTRTEDPRFR